MLVIAQIALSFLLLICGGLFIRSFPQLAACQSRFYAGSCAARTVDFFRRDTLDKTGLAFQRELLRRIERIPGVELGPRFRRGRLSVSGNLPGRMLPRGLCAATRRIALRAGDQGGPRRPFTTKIPLIAGRDVKAD